MCDSGLVVEAATLAKLGSSPGGGCEADSGRICTTTAVGIGLTASVLAQPTAYTVQQHMAKLWVLWHCWARIEDAPWVQAQGHNRTTVASRMAPSLPWRQEGFKD